MLKFIALSTLGVLVIAGLATAADKEKSDIDFKVKTIKGKEVDLAEKYKGKVLLVVNVASKCGLTPQYTALEALQKKYGERGFSVVGFPCNQFGGQEPGSSEDIQEFCSATYGVTFPMMEKVDVNGDGAHPLYQWLTREAPGLLGTTGIKWNFTKFLVGKDGKVIKRYAPKDKPQELARDIEAALAA